MKKITSTVCHCGNPKDNHRFRHLFKPSIEIDMYENEAGKTVFQVDALQWKPIKIEGKCKVPQCGKVKSMHWDGIDENEKKLYVIKHLFDSDKTREYRTVSFVIPIDAPCYECNKILDDHDDSHLFKSMVTVNNRGDDDRMKIKHASGKKIKIDIN